MAADAVIQAERGAFSGACREWRRFRKLSQLELSLAASVSQRHLSWLETGRSLPSREMILRLSEAMEIPLRERNQLLQSAGFSPAYPESALDEPGMQHVRVALQQLLDHQEPLPALVVDRLWNVKMRNRAADLLLELIDTASGELLAACPGDELNLAVLTLHPEGLRPYISNWQQVAPAFVQRLRSEAMASGQRTQRESFESFIALAGPLAQPPSPCTGLTPVLPLELKINGLALNLFSLITTFGTPRDVTTDELRIESFYPNDAGTAQFFRDLAV